MPYKNHNELPDNVKSVLPEHGQSIFMEAYNSAWDTYEEPSDRRGDDSREETSFKVAWDAVKQVFKKDKDGKWVKKE